MMLKIFIMMHEDKKKPDIFNCNQISQLLFLLQFYQINAVLVTIKD